MSQDKRNQPPASQNIFSLYGYQPQFSTNAVVTELPVQKSSMGSQLGGQGGTVYLSQLISEATHAGGQQSSASTLAVPQPHNHPAPSAQTQHPIGVIPATASLLKGQSQQSVGQSFVHSTGVLPSVFASPATNSASFRAAQPASASSLQQTAAVTEGQSASLTSNKWPAQQQFSSYISSGQAGVSASVSLPASSHIIVQAANTQRQPTEMPLSGCLSTTMSHKLIQQGLLANPLYSQGPVSSVGPVTPAHTQPQTGSVKMLPSISHLTSTNSQPQPSSQNHSFKRKSSSPMIQADSMQVQCDSKQPRTTLDSQRISDIGRHDGIVSAPHTTGISTAGWSGSSTTAKSSSGFEDTFRSFVETSRQGAYPQQKTKSSRDLPNPVVRESPGSSLMKRDDPKKGHMSQLMTVVGTGSQEGHRSDERQFDKTKKEMVRQLSKDEMHETIFRLGEEEPTAAGSKVGGQQTISGSNLDTILKTMGNLDSIRANKAGHPQAVSSTSSNSLQYFSSTGQNTVTLHTDPGKSSTSSVLQSLQSQSDHGQGIVKSEPAEEKDSLFESAAADHFKSSASTSPAESATSDSETESEASSTNSKKRPKIFDASAGAKKTKIDKTKPDSMEDTNPSVSSSKKQAKGTKNMPKGSPWDKPLVKVSLATLKRTGAPYLQNGSCVDLPCKVSKCRECRTAINQGSTSVPSIFCRFYAFRRLKYNPPKGTLMKAGFSELSDADPDLIEPWLPKFPMEDPQLDKYMAKFIISKVGDKFCELVQQEKEAKALPGADSTVVWKRAVTGVREMCDVCETTIFNMHWVCPKCGYVVCLDCYKAKVGISDGSSPHGETYRKWQICTSSRYPHDASKLILTQIIPSDALWELGRMIHDIRRKWSIPTACPCGQGGPDPAAAKSSKKSLNGVGDDGKPKTAAAAAAQASMKKELEAAKEPQAVKEVKQEEGSQKLGGITSLRELLTKTAGKGKLGMDKPKPKPTGGSSLNDIIQSVVEKSIGDMPGHAFKFLHYIPRLGQWKRELPIVAHSLTETSVLYPDVPHSWLCDGRLLRLHEPQHRGNLQIFQEQWKRGQPVMVSSVHRIVREDLWKPSSFSRQFGEKKNDLINCHNGDVITNHPMKDFWDGFESIENRLVDETGQDLMLKLKDWPPGDDFAELLPAHFKDLMDALPLPEYTRRDGKLNLASRLPEFLVRPDLGPKMYNAFGSAKYSKEATTNLHLDISDAVNVLVYVGVPNDGPGGRKEHEDAAVKAIDEAGCDSITKRRVREVHELPGALWQIYDAHDADKIRDFLNKVAKERGEEIEPNHDPIHDQSWYLDEELRERLLKEYGVHGYTIVQCMGDSVFIPAGAPHQVRNLHSCIKVAEDFVSPEHLNHCFRLTQEFRQLSDTHSNHEDKLQVKNIIYHAVKDSIAVLREMDPDDEQ